MPTLMQLLWLVCALLLVLACAVMLLLRKALQQGRSKKTAQNSLLSSQAPIVLTHTPSFSRNTVPPVPTPAPVFADALARRAAFAETHFADETRFKGAPSFDLAPLQQEVLFDDHIFKAAAETQAIQFAEIEIPSSDEIEQPREDVGVVDLEDERSSHNVTGIALFPATTGNLLAEFREGPYADPIDGVPFVAGEEVVPCTCGTAYRQDSAQWLREHALGACVQCHRALPEATEVIPERTGTMLLATSA